MNAQETVKEFWPEMDIWLRLPAHWRASMYIPFSRNLETNYREGSIVLQVDHAFGRSNPLHVMRISDEEQARAMRPFLGRGGYLATRSIGDRGETYNEDMAYLELHVRNPLKGRYLLSHRLRGELRWIGEDAPPSARIRYRFMAEKEILIGTISVVPYFNVEPYYDSRYRTVNRVRYITGGTVAWYNRFALEGNFTYQHDTRSSVTDLYAFNLILHVYFKALWAANKVGGEGWPQSDPLDAVGWKP